MRLLSYPAGLSFREGLSQRTPLGDRNAAFFLSDVFPAEEKPDHRVGLWKPPRTPQLEDAAARRPVPWTVTGGKYIDGQELATKALTDLDSIPSPDISYLCCLYLCFVFSLCKMMSTHRSEDCYKLRRMYT